MSAQALRVEESAINAGMMQDIVRADGYIWLKYGQKHVYKSYRTRCYYKCSCSRSKSPCTAKKTVEYDRRRNYTLSTIHINYSKPHHNHPPPLEKRISEEEPSRPTSHTMHPVAASEGPEERDSSAPRSGPPWGCTLSPAGAQSTPEPLAMGGRSAAFGAIITDPDLAPIPHPVQSEDVPPVITPHATTAAISSNSTAPMAPEHAADSSAVFGQNLQQCAAPANNGDVDGVLEAAIATGCSSESGSSLENSPYGEAHVSIQLPNIRSFLLRRQSMPKREFSDGKDSLLDDTRCAKRERHTEGLGPACFNSPVVFEAASTNAEQPLFCSDSHGGAANDAFAILPLDGFEGDASTFILPSFENYDDLFWEDYETLDGPTELHDPVADASTSACDHSGVDIMMAFSA